MLQRVSPLLICLVVGCSSPEAEPPAAVWVGEDTAPAEDSGPDTAPEEEEEDTEDVGGPDWEPELVVDEIGEHIVDNDWVFDLEILHQVDLSIDSAGWDSLLADPYSYVEATASVDGVELQGVGLRIRGKFGSFREITGKPKFKIDFQEFNDGQTLYGLEQLSLNNAVVDCSYLKDPIAMEAFRAVGIPAPRTAMTKVSVNGEDYGLYVIIEPEDDVFLTRHFEDATGNFYDGKYAYDPVTYDYTLLDFNAGVDHVFQLEEGKDNGNDDISDVSRALRLNEGSPDFYAELGDVVDWENFHKEQLVEQFVGQIDGYGLNTNNYRVYFDPGNKDRANFIPWDMDYAFLYDYQWGRDWDSPVGNLAYACMTDATCKAAQQGYVEEVLTDLNDRGLNKLFNDLSTLTEAEARSDPKRECAVYYVDSYRSAMSGFLANRPGQMRTAWGL